MEVPEHMAVLVRRVAEEWMGAKNSNYWHFEYNVWSFTDQNGVTMYWMPHRRWDHCMMVVEKAAQWSVEQPPSGPCIATVNWSSFTHPNAKRAILSAALKTAQKEKKNDSPEKKLPDPTTPPCTYQPNAGP